jgi:hypothetical protein
MKDKIKYCFDFVPIVLLIFYTGYSIGTMLNNDYALQWQHYLGIAFLIVDLIVLIKHHQLGAVLFGLILLLGLINIVSFDVGLKTTTFHITSAKIPIFLGNAMCLLWFIIHLTISFRYYVGIVTKKYWTDMLNKVSAE